MDDSAKVGNGGGEAGSLNALAAVISNASRELSAYCNQSGHPSPINTDSGSLAKDAHIISPDTAESVRQARQTLRNAAYEILLLSSGPSEFLEDHEVHYQQLACLKWLHHFNIVSHVPLTGTIQLAELARKANVPVEPLRSVVRMSITGGFLREPEPYQIAHSHISARFVAEPEYQDWAGFMTKYLVPAANQLPEATERWGDTKETNQTAFNCAFNTDLTTFEYMESKQASSDHFSRYMRSLGKSSEFSLGHILEGFDWASLGEAQVVDVGGSSGHIAILLATHNPQLRVKILDLPVTTINTEPTLSHLEPSVASRVSCIAHDFFNPFPKDLSAATDVYFLRRILHDWPFPSAQVILQNLATALKPGAVIVIAEMILQPSGSIPARAEARLCVRDLTMVETQNSKERELGEWIELFESVTPKLRLKGYKQPSGSVLTLLVAEVAK